MKWPKRLDTGRAPPAEQPLPASRQAERRRLVLAAALAATAIVAACLSAYVVTRPSNPSAVAEAAALATPDVAALLLEADDVAGGVVAVFPGDPRAYHILAWLHSRYGKADEAARCWQRSAELDPSWAVPHFSMGLIAEEHGQQRRAAECFGRAAELDPQSPVYPVYHARVLTERGDLSQAAAVLEKLVESNPSSVAPRVTLGETHLQMRQYALAREHFEAAISLAPELASPYYGLGTACTRLGDQEAAQHYLKKFQKLKARDEQAHRDELKGTRDNTASVRADVAHVYVEAGKTFLAHGDFETGGKHLRRAIELDANNAAVYPAIAWLQEQRGRSAEALATLKTAMDRLPEELTLAMSLGKLATRLQRFDEAEKAYRKAIELTPNSAGGYATLADVYLRAGRNVDDAQRLAQKAASLEPKAAHYVLLGAACERAGDLAAALAAIDHALRLDPKNRDCLRLRAMLTSSGAENDESVSPSDDR